MIPGTRHAQNRHIHRARSGLAVAWGWKKRGMGVTLRNRELELAWGQRLESKTRDGVGRGRKSQVWAGPQRSGEECGGRPGVDQPLGVWTLVSQTGKLPLSTGLVWGHCGRGWTVACEGWRVGLRPSSWSSSTPGVVLPQGLGPGSSLCRTHLPPDPVLPASAPGAPPQRSVPDHARPSHLPVPGCRSPPCPRGPCPPEIILFMSMFIGSWHLLPV